ncbi:hypothetical protein L1049_013591 [Liquidambar formosana]|uniref:Uncharacterized protein n=1 Tax=Liquidambar formosana TaxID=63359 RepID=A0AAP0WUF2_LIQFO
MSGVRNTEQRTLPLALSPKALGRAQISTDRSAKVLKAFESVSTTFVCSSIGDDAKGWRNTLEETLQFFPQFSPNLEDVEAATIPAVTYSSFRPESKRPEKPKSVLSLRRVRASSTAAGDGSSIADSFTLPNCCRSVEMRSSFKEANSEERVSPSFSV